VAVFVDTNVLLYWRDASEPDKQPQAKAWLDAQWRTAEGRTSIQVLQEFYVNVTRKLSPGLTHADATADVRTFLRWRPVVIDEDVLEEAWRIEERFGLSFWDAAIAAAAQVSGCRHLLTEDLQDGQELDGLVVIDPFTHTPTSIGLA
jgi:predicted nucleic acid-binding protein